MFLSGCVTIWGSSFAREGEIQEKQSDLQVVFALLDMHFECIGVIASECFIACQLSKGN